MSARTTGISGEGGGEETGGTGDGFCVGVGTEVGTGVCVGVDAGVA